MLRPRRAIHPRDNPGRSIPTQYLRREQRSDTGMLSPLHPPYATQGEAFQHNKFLRREHYLGNAVAPTPY
ncbi:MAG: hypothetical protein F6J93_16465 [Oscillatoria sp. SIO1A7]|nr:hypothetical protein [Oscillatoria sp. SIO1A7]